MVFVCVYIYFKEMSGFLHICQFFFPLLEFQGVLNSRIFILFFLFILRFLTMILAFNVNS